MGTPVTSTPTRLAGPNRPATALTRARHGVVSAFPMLAVAFTMALFVQIYLAGAGAFAHHSVYKAFAAHENLGNILGIVAVVLLVLALITRLNRATMIGSFRAGRSR